MRYPRSPRPMQVLQNGILDPMPYCSSLLRRAQCVLDRLTKPAHAGVDEFCLIAPSVIGLHASERVASSMNSNHLPLCACSGGVSRTRPTSLVTLGFDSSSQRSVTRLS